VSLSTENFQRLPWFDTGSAPRSPSSIGDDLELVESGTASAESTKAAGLARDMVRTGGGRSNVAACRYPSFLVLSRFRKIYGLKYWKRRVARLCNLYFAVPEK
jgi:hypothetical protein